MADAQEKCFFIMPFSKTNTHTKEYWTTHFDTFLKPLAEENKKIQASRARPIRGDILRQIITDLVTSRIVVADLTDHNPNVLWELGVRQSFKHSTITIAEDGTRLPFDISSKGTLFYYPKDHLKMLDFKKDFSDAINDCLSNPDSPDSVVLETVSGRGTLFEIFQKDEALRRIEALLSEINKNVYVIELIITQSTTNQNVKLGQERKYLTLRPRKAALSLLVTTRYIDEDITFYNLAENAYECITSLNDQLNCWEHSPAPVEDWFLSSGPVHKIRLKQLEEKLRTYRDKLESRI